MKNIWLIILFMVPYQTLCQDFLAECDTKRDELAKEGNELKIEFRKNMNEAGKGMMCSVCGNTKNELEKSRRETFNEHLNRVDGVAIQPTAFDIQEKQNNLKRRHNEQIDRINERIDRNNKDCREKVKEWNKEQNRLAEEKRKEKEQKKIDDAKAAAQAEKDMLDKMRKDQEAIEAENQKRKEKQMQQALANQRKDQTDLLNYTQSELGDLREVSRENVVQKVEDINNENEKYLNVSIGNGLSEKNNDYSFDTNKMSDGLSGDNYDEDNFMPDNFYDKANEVWDNASTFLKDTRRTIKSFVNDYTNIISADATGKMAEYIVDMKNNSSNVTKKVVGKVFSFAQTVENTKKMGSSFGEYMEDTWNDIFKKIDYTATFNKSQLDPNYDPNGFWDRQNKRNKKFFCYNNIPWCSTADSMNKQLSN